MNWREKTEYALKKKWIETLKKLKRISQYAVAKDESQ